MYVYMHVRMYVCMYARMYVYLFPSQSIEAVWSFDEGALGLQGFGFRAWVLPPLSNSWIIFIK